MRVSQAKELFRSLTAQYFAGAEVTLSRQSRVAKPQVPLVSITPGNVNRPSMPNYEEVDGVLVGHYLSRISMQVDLFTHGLPVKDEETGQTIAYENTAMDDMLAFMDFLNSPYAVEWCHTHDVAIAFDGDQKASPMSRALSADRQSIRILQKKPRTPHPKKSLKPSRRMSKSSETMPVQLPQDELRQKRRQTKLNAACLRMRQSCSETHKPLDRWKMLLRSFPTSFKRKSTCLK